MEERTIGASLGEASIRSGVLASVGGLTLVMLFMLGYYRLAGVNAIDLDRAEPADSGRARRADSRDDDAAGIAGLILTIGMGVDSNVLIFERIKEELGPRRPAHERPSAPGSTGCGSPSSTPTSRR